MVFASITFLYLFLPANLLLYFLIPQKDYRNILLVFFSLLFYAWGEPVWITLIFISSGVDYLVGRYIERVRGSSKARLGVLSSLVVNLGLLGTFKYSGFLCESLNSLLPSSLALPVPEFSLPIGISFYTFQTISYTVDVYRGRVSAERSYLRFLMFVSLYHQLVAGPIVRYADISHEISQRRHSASDVARGFSRFSMGLFKKVCIANVAGVLASRYLDGDLGGLSVAEGWLGMLMFSFQIYFDFSGYSDMAIGLGLIAGFHYQENFNYPYIARSASEFWRRWHISLGSFFKDYVYIPLGGNRRWPYRNLFIVWGLTGLWHGASWNFVLWGLYYGVLIFLEKRFYERALIALPQIFSHLYLIFITLLGWSLFYFTDLDRLLSYLKIIFGGTQAELLGPLVSGVFLSHLFWFLLAALLCLPLYPKLTRWAESFSARSKRHRQSLTALTMLANLFMLLLATSMLVGKSYNPFLYFRF